jgi:hypothetical protein
MIIPLIPSFCSDSYFIEQRLEAVRAVKGTRPL